MMAIKELKLECSWKEVRRPRSYLVGEAGPEVFAPPANDNAIVKARLENLHYLPSYIYVGTPYTKFAAGLEEANRQASVGTAILMRMGFRCLSPIAHSHAVAVLGGVDPLDWTIWKDQNEPLMAAASALVVLKLDGWEESVGLAHEIEAFASACKPIVYVTLGELERVAA